MDKNNQILQEFILELQKLITDNYENCVEIVRLQGLKPTLTLNNLITWQGTYRQLKKDTQSGVITPKDWFEQSRMCIARMNNCLSDLGEDELEEGTLENFIQEKEPKEVDSEMTHESISFDEFENFQENRFNNKRIILEKIDISQIVIPEESDILKKSKKRAEFRRRMTDIQDFLTLGAYSKALEECEYILKNLELQSSQLHEYHTISYFKIKGGEYGIIQDIQSNKEDTLKQLTLCIMRCRLFNKNETSTFEKNVEFICYRMSIILRQFYRGTPTHNYINQDDNQNLRHLISRYITTGLALTTEIYKGNMPITLFIEDAFIEINGGRKLEWIDVTVDWQIRNRDSFFAIEIRNDIAKILKKTNSWELCRKRLSRNLSIKYSNIKVSNRTNASTVEARQAFRRFFKASIIAYKCFEDVRFLELFKAELLHTGKLTWFQLDESGKIPKLVAHPECLEIGYDPFKDLQRLKSRFNQSDFQIAIDTLFEDLKKQKQIKLIEDKVEETDKRYNDLMRIVTKRDSHFRKQVIDCIYDWQNAYEVVKYDEIINKVIKELIGKEGLLFWFELNDDAVLVNHKECRDLGFDSKNNLNEGIDKSMSYYQRKDLIWKEITLKAAEILEQEANSKYEQF